MVTESQHEIREEVGDSTKPPFLRRVRIQGFKSIAFCDVPLLPFTILVGRNGSGKSNFLSALAFLRDALEDGPDAALERHGGDAVFCRTTGTNRLMFEVESTFPGHQMWCRAVYRVEFVLTARKQLEVEQEVLQLEDSTHNKHCGFSASHGQVTWHGLESFGEGGYQRGTPNGARGPADLKYPSFFAQYRSDRLLLGVIGSQPFIDLADGLRSIGCFNFHPDSIREPQKSVGSPALKRDGRNLARAIEGLWEIDKNEVARVRDYLAVIVPEVAWFEVIPVGDRETIRFTLVSSDKNAIPLELNAESMSDGTLRALATLIAAFQIHLPTGPAVVGIEEPETALHPAGMRALVDALEEATQRTQILITTQSPDLLSGRDIAPGQLLVVRNRDGRTLITPVDPASRQIIAKELYSLADLQRMDQLELDEADLERQARLSNGMARA